MEAEGVILLCLICTGRCSQSRTSMASRLGGTISYSCSWPLSLCSEIGALCYRGLALSSTRSSLWSVWSYLDIVKLMLISMVTLIVVGGVACKDTIGCW